LPKYLFIFGYESPAESRVNRSHGTDFESSDAVWIDAMDEIAAMTAGYNYADSFVQSLYRAQGEPLSAKWSDAAFAAWIEVEPLRRFTQIELESLTCIQG
jgi:hypothetical protein